MTGAIQASSAASAGSVTSGPPYALIGAELHTGSDSVGAMSTLAEPYLGELLGTARTVLFAGAHDPAVVARAADRAATTVQVRRVPDAASGRYSGAEILCGAIDHVDGTYDVVVALGGLDAATSPDAAARDAVAATAALAARVGSAGTLVVAAANAFGLERINSLRGRTERADPYAIGYDAVVRELRAAGLTVTAALAVYPALPSASLLIHRDMLDVPADRDLAAMLVGAAAASGPAPMMVGDPARLATDAVEHGVAFSLAPAWVIIASRPAAPDAFLPVMAWTAGGLGDVTITERARGMGAYRPGTRLAEWRPQRTLPQGRLLNEALLTAAGRQDMQAMRDLLRRYYGWLGAQAPGGACPLDRRAATPSGVIDDGAEFHLLVRASPEADDDPAAGGVPRQTPTARRVLLAGLLDLARLLQSSGALHPWPGTLTVVRLSVALASVAGVTVTEDEVALIVAERDQSPGQVAVRELGDADSEGEMPAPIGPMGDLARPSGYAEAVQVAGELSRELAEAREQLRFLTEVIADRDRRLRDKSAQRRALRLLRHPLRTLGRRARSH